MKIAAGKFKDICLELMDRVAETGESVVITKRDKAVAELVRPRAAGVPRIYGCMKNSLRRANERDDLFSTDEAWHAER